MGYWKGKHFSEEHRRKLSESHAGKVLTEAHRKAISESLKGKSSPRKGQTLSAETCRRMSESRKGREVSAETRAKISAAHTGMRASDETKKRIGESSRGRPAWNKGKTLGPMPEERRRKHSKALKGDRHPNWQGGKTADSARVRRSLETRLWREAVFQRDDFTCQECSARGVYLHVHHIQSFAKHPELRFDVENGITLCKSCHEKTPNYKSRKA